MKRENAILTTVIFTFFVTFTAYCGGSDSSDADSVEATDAGQVSSKTDAKTGADPDSGKDNPANPADCGKDSGKDSESSGGESGGSGGDGGSGGTGGSGGDVTTFEMTVEEGAISTIAIVEWTTDVDPIDSAYIEYGLDTDYGSEIEVDLDAENHRTVILGLKGGNQTYNLRAVVTSDGKKHYSDNQTFTTGAVPNALPEIEVTWNEPLKDKIEKGFTLTSAINTNSYIVILDSDGEYVWWYALEKFALGTNNLAGASQVVPDWGGENLYAISANASFDSVGSIARVSIDGESETRYDYLTLDRDFHAHHSLTALPEGGVAFIEYDPGTGCDVINHLDEDGNITELYDIHEEMQYPTDPPDLKCHANFVSYVPSVDAFAISLLGFDTVLLVNRDKEVLWAIGADAYQTAVSDPDWEFGGQDESFESQHGLYVLNDGKSLLLFNNGGDDTTGSSGQTAIIWQYTFDDSYSKATGVDYYKKERLNSGHFGNAQMLPGGNALLDYSTAGVIMQVTEISAENVEVVQKLKALPNAVFGYASWTESLYGPPTRL